MNLEVARRDFLSRGFCYIEKVISEADIARVSSAVHQDVWAHNHLEKPTGYVPGFLRYNQDIAPYLTAEPLIRFVDSFFGPHVRISMLTGIVNGSGINRGALHSDWPYNQNSAAHIPAPYPDTVLHIVTM